MLVICEVKYGFLDIFIWFDRVRRALLEYEYQKKIDAFSNTKTWKKSGRLIKISYILHKREYAELLIISADRLFRLLRKLGKVIFSFTIWHCILKHKLIVDQLELLRVKRILWRNICQIFIRLSSFLQVLYWKED